jgi:hypothetical protein
LAPGGRLVYVNPSAWVNRARRKAMRTKTEVLSELQTMLRDLLAAAAAGAGRARIARAHGYVDGYMRALLDLGVADQAELLQLVASERERVSGPAVRVLDPSPGEVASGEASGDTVAA